jgi:hypothetical protein
VTNEIGGHCIEIATGGHRKRLNVGWPLKGEWGSQFDLPLCFIS